jgi:hypothetical protein
MCIVSKPPNVAQAGKHNRLQFKRRSNVFFGDNSRPQTENQWQHTTFSSLFPPQVSSTLLSIPLLHVCTHRVPGPFVVTVHRISVMPQEYHATLASRSNRLATMRITSAMPSLSVSDHQRSSALPSLSVLLLPRPATIVCKEVQSW